MKAKRMKMKNRALIAAAHVVLALAAPAAPVPKAWTVDVRQVRPFEFEAVRGETVALEATFTDGARPFAMDDAPCFVYWQTNGMGRLVWKEPAAASGNVVRATWTPGMDPGGKSVRGWLGQDGRNYRGLFAIRFTAGPGAVPNALELPVPRIDFAAVEVANAPWLAEETDPTVPAWAKAGTKPAYTAAEVGAADAAEVASLKDGVGALSVGYARLYSFATGATNANFSATNYPPTKAEADARRHFAPEPGMDFSDVPASLQLNEFRDGAWRTVVDTRDWTVWYCAFREARLTNEIARLKAANAALSNRLERAKAWADTTANGAENPMGDTVVVDRPNMWLMAGYEWQKCVSGSNRCFVIRAKDVALAGGSGASGFLEVADAFGRPYLRVNKSADSFADPVVDEISFDAGEGAWYVVFGNSQRPARGGANAALDGNGAGEAILYAEDDPRCPAEITWPERPDSVAGHWIMRAVPKPVGGAVPETMFFGAEKITVAGQDYVEYLKEASFGAGVRVGTNVYDAVESGDTLTWRRRK